MDGLETWLAYRGPALAIALDSLRVQICDGVSLRLATAFPKLCYDPSRTDAQAFQIQTFLETPRRFHRLLQILLKLHLPAVIEREYRWGWEILQRYGVERYHLQAQVSFYFEEVRALLVLDNEDILQLNNLETMILQIIEQVTAPVLPAPHNGRLHMNGVAHHHP